MYHFPIDLNKYMGMTIQLRRHAKKLDPNLIQLQHILTTTYYLLIVDLVLLRSEGKIARQKFELEDAHLLE